MSSEWCDEGAKWLLANGLTATGDDAVDKQQEEYAKFTQKVTGHPDLKGLRKNLKAVDFFRQDVR